MSNIFHSQNLETDFEAFQTALVLTSQHNFTISAQVKPALKKYHRFTYVIALLQSKIERKCANSIGNKFLFLNEILSDLLTISSISFIGFIHPAYILFRRAIENFYNHIYYFDHPVEFELLNLGRNEYAPIMDLKKYLEEHPTFKSFADKNIKIFNDQILAQYQELCKIVHTKGESFMGLAKNLEEIKPEFDLKLFLEEVNKMTSSMIYILFRFHRNVELSHVETDIVAKSFPRELRNSLLG